VLVSRLLVVLEQAALSCSHFVCHLKVLLLVDYRLQGKKGGKFQGDPRTLPVGGGGQGSRSVHGDGRVSPERMLARIGRPLAAGRWVHPFAASPVQNPIVGMVV
jgi:hypothetical protein